MKQKELRIGNYLLDKYKTYVRVESIWDNEINWQYDCGECWGESLSIFEPIALTEELLLKCGFDKRLSGVYGFGDEDIYLEKKELGWNYTICISFNNGEFAPLRKVDFLHEVQNLFWCLNGEELNISL